MKPLKRILPLLLLFLCVCLCFSSCAVQKTETATKPETARDETATTAENGGVTEMTTDRRDETAAKTTAKATATTAAATEATAAATTAAATEATAAAETTAVATEATAAAETTAEATEATAATTDPPVTLHVHEFGAWTVGEAATCTEPGTEQRVCSTCSEREEREIAPKGHTSPDGDGKCTRCGALIVYSYPMDQVTLLDGTIVTKSNKFTVMVNYRGGVIDLTDLAFDTVQITRNADVSEMGYAFLTALPTAGQVPSYATGYSMVIWDENATATLSIPENAKYLYVYYTDAGVSYLPSEVVFSYASVPTSFTVASWNIGHYSMGTNKNTKISDENYATEKAKYDAYIDSLGADVLILNEYSKLFTPSHAARYLFLDYGCPFEGEQRNYSCNALYSKFPLKNVTLHDFACNTPDTVLHTTAIKATDYYYITGELTVGNKTVTIVGLHLAFHDKLYPDTVCTNQMDELIATFADTERVIILGDWNAYHAEYYERFAEAGYTVANNGEYLTCTGSKTGGLEWPVDNIIVKGVTMTDFRAVDTSLSDHVAVVATITLE